MFADDEDWDSTRNQDDFIKNYFGKEKVNSTTKNSPTKAVQQESEYSSPSSHLLKNKHSLNHQLECNKKRKKEKKSLHDSSQEYSSEIHSQSQNITGIESPSFESNNVKKKKKNKKKKLVNKSNSNECSKQMENADDTSAETVTDNFSTNSIKTIDMHSNEMDSDCLKLKKKRRRLKNKDNSITEGNVSLPSEAETISDVAFNDSLISNNNSSENDSDSNTLKVKKKKLKNKSKNIDKSSKSNNFFDAVETISDSVFNDSSVRENSLSRNNSDSFKKIKKKLKNSEKSLECDEFSDESEPTTFEVSRDLLLKKNNLLQSKAYQKLQAAKFRYLNEMLYTNSGKDALSYFQENTDEYLDYHLGYQSQVSKWPINPVDIIIQEISRINEQAVIADLGCGEAKIAEVFPKRSVHSFDLIALKDGVTACDMANVPLPTNSVDVVVFCLSLMGTNWKDYLKESQRILKFGGIMKIAEIESRIENVQHFIKEIETFGFSLINQNLSHKMFVFLNFKRENRNKKSSKVPAVTLKPCLYKKR